MKTTNSNHNNPGLIQTLVRRDKTIIIGNDQTRMVTTRISHGHTHLTRIALRAPRCVLKDKDSDADLLAMVVLTPEVGTVRPVILRTNDGDINDIPDLLST